MFRLGVSARACVCSIYDSRINAIKDVFEILSLGLCGFVFGQFVGTS